MADGTACNRSASPIGDPTQTERDFPRLAELTASNGLGKRTADLALLRLTSPSPSGQSPGFGTVRRTLLRSEPAPR